MTRSRQTNGQTGGETEGQTDGQTVGQAVGLSDALWPGCGMRDVGCSELKTLYAHFAYNFWIEAKQAGQGQGKGQTHAFEDVAHLMRLNFVFILVKCIEIGPSLTRQQTDS